MPRPLDPGLSLVATLDLEALQEDLLAAMAAAADAQGAALWIAEETGALALRGLRGLVDREALPARLDPGSSALGAALLRGVPFEPGGFPEGDAFLVPLACGGEVGGMVLLERSPRGAFGPEQRDAAAALARFASVAVRNARRFRALERANAVRASRPRDLAYLVDHAAREVHAARRYGRSFSVALFALEDGEALAREVGREAADAAARGLAAALSRAVRDADVLASASGVEHHLLLPETDHFGARILQRRAWDEIRREPAVGALDGRAVRRVSIGAATFPRDGDDLDSLLRSCRRRQAERRSSMRFQPEVEALAESASFWRLFDALLRGAPIPAGSPSARLPLDPELLDEVERETAREIGRDARARGVVYLAHPGAGAGHLAAALARRPTASRQGDTGSRVYALGPRSLDPGRDHPLVTHVAVDDPRLEGHAFLLFLSETASYALLQGPGGDSFHTSDAPLVDALVARLQAQYDLQPL